MVKSAYVRVIAAGFVLSVLGAAPACGGDDDDGGSGGASAGAAGKGGSGGGGGTMASSLECGPNTCAPLILPFPGAEPVAACCASGDACGVDASVLEAFGTVFEEKCQERDQPGELDTACPDSVETEVADAGVTLPPFKGCCRSDVGKCGYMLDKLFGTVVLGLGCVQSEPFTDGEPAPSCGTGTGAAGAGSAGGPGESGTAGAGQGGVSGAAGSGN